MENIYTIASSSSSTTYGNIMSVFKDIMIKMFPFNYFNDVYVSSEISYTNIRRRLGRNSITEMSKLERPFMNINPQIQPPNGDLYLFDIPLTKNIDNMEVGLQRNTLFSILKNTVDHYSLNYKLNRDQIQFEMTITVDTLIQQLDLYKYMLNHFVWERPFALKASLESMIPREMISYMGKISNIDIDSSDTNQIPAMLKMMNMYSRFPITYKMRNGTALDEFFMYYNAELLITYGELSLEPVNRKNMADDYYQITFRATVDFNLPGMYALIGEHPRPLAVGVSLRSDNKDGTHDLVPLYTVNNLYAKYSSVKNGFILLTSSRFQTERDPKTKQDTLNLTVLFEQDYLRVIKENYVKNIPMNTLFDIILLKDGEELHEKDDWYVKWNTMDIVINNADDTATYCILIYINNSLFNERITGYKEENLTDKPSI